MLTLYNNDKGFIDKYLL